MSPVDDDERPTGAPRPAARPPGETSGRVGARSNGRLRWGLAATSALARRPELWPTAVRQALVLAPPGWWRTRPWLPWPDPAYLRFRLQTAYGDSDRRPTPADLVTYLHWCRAWPRVTR